MLFIYQKDDYGSRNYKLLHKEKYDFPLECLKISADGKVLVGFSEHSDSNNDEKGERLETVTVYNILLKKLITRQILNLNDKIELREDPSKLFLISKSLTS